MKLTNTIGELLADELDPEMSLKHRLGTGIVRLVVGGLAGAIAVKVYKDQLVGDEDSTDDEDTEET